MHSVVVIDGEAELETIIDGDNDSSQLNIQDGEANDVLVYQTGTYFHDELHHRDYPNQHPISAIEGLTETLAAKPDLADLSIIYCGTSTEVI